MVVLLTGASGFIGEHLAPALRAAGHRVIGAAHGRHTEGDAVAVDYTRDFDPSVWKPRLADIDAVINAVGIPRERGAATFDALHVRTPRAFAAAVDIALGIATLVARSRWLWRFQIAIIVAYTAINSVALPDLWAHPFGPVLKSLPMLAALLLLLQFEDR